MSKRKLLLMGISIFIIFIFVTPVSSWPDEQGDYYVMEIEDQAPNINGELDRDDEWTTDEEFYRDSISSLVFDDSNIDSITVNTVILRDVNFLYIKVNIESPDISADQPISVGIALSDGPIDVNTKNLFEDTATAEDGLGMQSTEDRKVSYFDGNSVNNTDFHGCRLYTNLTEWCTGDNYQPGVPDQTNFDAFHGYDEENEQVFFEFKLPLTNNETVIDEEGNTVNTDLSIPIDNEQRTHLKILVNPTDNMAASGVGHGNQGTNELILQYEPRCFFCRPEGPIDTASLIFNGLFAVTISGIFLAFIFSGHSEAVARRLWRVDVSEDMAEKSVLMEMAYYNSSFISLLVASLFFMYSIIAFLYGFWANWGPEGAILNGIPTLFGLIAIVDLISRNKNPQELSEEELKRLKVGTDVQESSTFWIVPTLFLFTTLFMLVFIGISVIT